MNELKVTGRILPISEATRKANPAIFGPQPVGGLDNPERQHDPVPPLVNRPKTRPSRKARVALCVKIVSVRNRQADEDNIISGAKKLRDSIARSLGIDDGDPRILWEYDTIITRGAVGTQVIISMV